MFHEFVSNDDEEGNLRNEMFNSNCVILNVTNADCNFPIILNYMIYASETCQSREKLHLKFS